VWWKDREVLGFLQALGGLLTGAGQAGAGWCMHAAIRPCRASHRHEGRHERRPQVPLQHLRQACMPQNAVEGHSYPSCAGAPQYIENRQQAPAIAGALRNRARILQVAPRGVRAAPRRTHQRRLRWRHRAPAAPRGQCTRPSWLRGRPRTRGWPPRATWAGARRRGGPQGRCCRAQAASSRAPGPVTRGARGVSPRRSGNSLHFPGDFVSKSK